MIRSVAENQDLRWLYHESDCDIGYRSTMGGIIDQLRASGVAGGEVLAEPGMVEHVACRSSAGASIRHDPLAAALLPGWVSPSVPTKEQRYAASRLRMLHRALVQLSPLHQAVIGHAYTMRNFSAEPGGLKLVSTYGAAAGAVRHVLAHYKTAVSSASDEARQAREAAARVMANGGDVPAAKRRLSEARRNRDQLERDAENAPERAVQLLREAHEAFAVALRSVRDELRAERKRARANRDALTEARIVMALGRPLRERRAAETKAWMAEHGLRVV